MVSELVQYYTQGMFSFAIIFIAFFITVYSYQFLTKTISHKERRPWDFLFVASLLFLIFEFFSLLMFFRVIELVAIDIVIWSKIFEFLYSGFVLLAFISQNDLILKNHLILISKKDSDQKIKEEVKQELKEIAEEKKTENPPATKSGKQKRWV